jgi:uncharacterized protein
MKTTTTTFPGTHENSLTGVAGEKQPHSLARAAASNQQRPGVWPALWLYLLVTWLAGGALIELQPLTHLSTQIIEISQFGPSIAVLVVLARRRAARLQLWQGPPAATLRRIAAGAAIVAAVFGSCMAALALTGHPVHITSPASLGEPFWLIAAAQLIGACGEELGWRSFLQPHLQQRYSPLISAVIVGTLWGTWHVMYLSDGALFFVLFLLLTIALSVIMAELIRGVSSLPVAGVFHWLINLATLLLINFASGNLTDITTLTIGFTTAAILIKTTTALRSRATAENS